MTEGDTDKYRTAANLTELGLRSLERGGYEEAASTIRAQVQQEMRNEIRDLRENYAHIIEKIQYLDLKLGIVLAQQNLTHTRLQALEYGKIPELEREEKQNGKHRHNG